MILLKAILLSKSRVPIGYVFRCLTVLMPSCSTVEPVVPENDARFIEVHHCKTVTPKQPAEDFECQLKHVETMVCVCVLGFWQLSYTCNIMIIYA